MSIIHETLLKDIVDLIGDTKDFVDKQDKMLGNNDRVFKSLTRNANKLILVFPVLCTKGIDIETASMLAKAIEKYCVTLLELLFASIQITDTTDLQDYISRFHSNISIGDKITVDDFVAFTNTLESAIEEGHIKVSGRAAYNKFKEGMKEFNNIAKVTLNENSLADFACHRTYNGYETILEKIITAGPDSPTGFNMYEDDYDDARDHFMKSKAKNDQAKRDFRERREKERREKERRDGEPETIRTSNLKRPTGKLRSYEKEEPETIRTSTDRKYKLRQPNGRLKPYETGRSEDRMTSRDYRERREYINKLSDNDIKKANELMPTKVVVDFYSKDAQVKFESGIIGVKCKIYTVDSMELIERISTKYADSNWVRELVRASTGEISFWRDFVFALDRAKIDAINSAKKGSSAKMWKVLERRATKHRLSKWKANRADSSPITTLIVSQDEVEYLKKDYDIDLENRKIAMKLMESYNFMGIVIADEPAETASFIWDEGNDAQYDTISFRNLERESSDRNYKKVISLMTKISR